MLYIPVTLHIVGNDDGTGFYPPKSAYEAFCQLQRDFIPGDMVFYLADTLIYHRSTLYNNHSDFGTGADMVTDYAVPNTLNCFIVESAAGNCGYAWYGGAIVLKNSCTTLPGHTWAHEAGHYFSLPHVFSGWEGQTVNTSVAAPFTTTSGDEVELADSSNCATAGDLFCDTPADYLSYRWSCDAARNSQNLIDPTGRNFKATGEYYMSYALDNCMTKFSPQQLTAMRDYAQTNLPSITQLTAPPYQVVGQSLLNMPADSATVRYDSLRLFWKKDPNATKYIVEICRLKSFNVGIITHTTSDTSSLYVGLTPGKRYYWRARALNPRYVCSSPSVIRTFVTQPLIVATEENTPFKGELKIVPNQTERGKNVTISWENIEVNQAKLQIFSINGQLLSEKIVFPQIQQSTEIETANLPSGVLVVNLQTEKGSIKQKMVVTN